MEEKKIKNRRSKWKTRGYCSLYRRKERFYAVNRENTGGFWHNVDIGGKHP
jgi:hypothetical protein